MIRFCKLWYYLVHDQSVKAELFYFVDWCKCCNEHLPACIFNSTHLSNGGNTFPIHLAISSFFLLHHLNLFRIYLPFHLMTLTYRLSRALCLNFLCVVSRVGVYVCGEWC